MLTKTVVALLRLRRRKSNRHSRIKSSLVVALTQCCTPVDRHRAHPQRLLIVVPCVRDAMDPQPWRDLPHAPRTTIPNASQSPCVMSRVCQTTLVIHQRRRSSRARATERWRCGDRKTSIRMLQVRQKKDDRSVETRQSWGVTTERLQSRVRRLGASLRAEDSMDECGFGRWTHAIRSLILGTYARI